GEFQRALKIVDGLSASGPAQSEIESVRTEIAAAQDAARLEAERQKRADAIRAAIADAGKLLASGKPREALDCLERLQSRYGPADEIAEVRARAEQAAAIALAVREADALTEAGRPTEAAGLLERAQSESGTSSALEDALRRARAAIAAQERERALAEIVDTVRSHIRSNEFGRALAAVDPVDPVPAADPRLDALRAEISSAREVWASAQQIASAVRECQRLCGEGKYEAAFD